MRFRKIALALFACMALGAFAANAAQANWTVGKPGNVLSGSETVECEKHFETELILHSTVLGAPITLTAGGIGCVESSIDNTVEANHSKGKLRFTGITVHPESCEVPNGELETAELTDRVKMDPSNAEGPVFDEFFPEEGNVFVEVPLVGTECPFNGVTAPVKGTACGEAVHTNGEGGWAQNETGELRSTQTLLFGAAQQSTGGCELKLGKAEAQLTGAVDNELAGANAGQLFGAD